MYPALLFLRRDGQLFVSPFLGQIHVISTVKEKLDFVGKGEAMTDHHNFENTTDGRRCIKCKLEIKDSLPEREKMVKLHSGCPYDNEFYREYFEETPNPEIFKPNQFPEQACEDCGATPTQYAVIIEEEDLYYCTKCALVKSTDTEKGGDK